LGLLKYLASELGVSVKQVTRYWDRNLIPNRYRTPGGARRIRYKHGTVEQVRRMVDAAKETNIQIRYRLAEIRYKGLTVSVKGCNSMDDLYRRARKVGLSKREAADLAYRPRLKKPSPSSDEVAWQVMWALQGTSHEEVVKSMRELDCIPLLLLMAAKSDEDFQLRAKRALENIESSLTNPEQQKAKIIAKELLSERDLRTFVQRWNEATELEQTEARVFYQAKEQAVNDRDRLNLQVAVLRLKHQQSAPSSLALANSLNMSRPGLYRTFGVRAIQNALMAIRNDARSVLQSRNDKWARGQNRHTKAPKT